MAWFFRFLHLAGGIAWLGTYVVLVSAMLPQFKSGEERVKAGILQALRLASTAGAVTILAGLGLVSVTRGFDAFGRGEWGGSVAGSLLLSVALLGIQDGVIRRAIKRDGVEKARKWAAVLLGVGILIVAIMARLPMAR